MTTFALARPAVSSRTALGVAALATVVVLWSTFALTSRAIGGSSLTVADASLLRFAVPAVVLAPWIPRTLRALRGEKPLTLALVLLAGLPHFLLFAGGADLTSAALTGLLVPGTVPVFVTLLLFVGARRAVPPAQLGALAAIVAGVVVSAAVTGGRVSGLGIGVLIIAGFVWALYTVGLAATRLGVVEVLVVVSVSSTIAMLALMTSGAMPSHLFPGIATVTDLGTFALLQGVGTGLLSTACYVVAVKNLGSGIAGAAGALSPVLTAVVAVPLLGESLGVGLLLALALIVAGVALFNLAPVASIRPPTPNNT